MKNKSKKIYIININGIAYFIIFSILIAVVIWFISKGMQDVNISIPLTKAYSVDQANAINALANNATGRINNTIAVSAIFFTVIVASISVFQFVKIKDFDKIKENILINTAEIEEKIKESNLEIVNLRDEYMKLDILRQNLEFRNARLQVELNDLKIDKCLSGKGYWVKELRDLLNSNIKLGDEFKNLLSKSELSELYFQLGKSYIATCDIYETYIYMKKILKKSLELIKDSNEDNQKIDTYKLMIDMEQTRGNYEEVAKILDDMGNLLEKDIEENLWLLANLNGACGWDKIDQCIKILDQLDFYYGVKCVEYIKRYDEDGSFNELKTNEKFKNKLYSIIGKNE
ncbi:hypothetical protein [Clostridium pasteurianum]|uniref:Uncharacterized protein n=1 Tax=Clostridium pasteurianum BC1 TaxID=86416 RepID=R4K079_CLOPA|nr:hypothetical protein [Clostridium pasteurianum]AGK95191.1 hypothetical protein Clopa_0091 [Clostridium pasteurianum BC1]